MSSRLWRQERGRSATWLSCDGVHCWHVQHGLGWGGSPLNATFRQGLRGQGRPSWGERVEHAWEVRARGKLRRRRAAACSPPSHHQNPASPSCQAGLVALLHASRPARPASRPTRPPALPCSPSGPPGSQPPPCGGAAASGVLPPSGHSAFPGMGSHRPAGQPFSERQASSSVLVPGRSQSWYPASQAQGPSSSLGEPAGAPPHPGWQSKTPRPSLKEHRAGTPMALRPRHPPGTSLRRVRL